MEQLIAYLESLNVKLWVEGGRLRYQAPLGVITSERLEQLREHKADIIQFLQKDKQSFNSTQPKVRRWSPLVGIQTLGLKPPFFCVHPLSGNILSFPVLSRHLGAEQPFYGLEAIGMLGQQEPLTTIEDLATCYIQAISVVQPSGPYFLGGYSFGGLVAFEMAQQLEQQGHEVALLAIIDTMAPTAKLDIAPANNDTDWIKLCFRIIEYEFRKKLPFVCEQVQKLQPQEQIDYFLETLKAANLISPNVGQEGIRRLVQLWMILAKAAMSYIPRLYRGKITLFRSSEELPLEDDRVVNNRFKEYAMGWGEFTTKPIEIYHIPGNHRTMMTEPNCSVLGDKLKFCLERAQAGSTQL
ncbi:thioesterase domain-containing protein [Microseira sp. BLCC-F43]|jgi:thioesterase domain-containing protein|uniref:thioesterase domain-containing protein n=1 Tax=Microseira sp. BLCC-F43 TaxID=3153602 RepID=UPI0035B9C3ED